MADRSNRRPTVGRAPEGGLGPGEAAGYGGEGGGVYGIWRPPSPDPAALYSVRASL